MSDMQINYMPISNIVIKPGRSVSITFRNYFPGGESDSQSENVISLLTVRKLNRRKVYEADIKI